MEVHILLFTGFLLRICQSQGSEDKFVRLGEDLLLDLKTSVKLSESYGFLWKFKNHQLEREVKVAKVTHDNKPFIFGKFKENSEILQNYSLLLRKVKHSNTGTYTGLVSGEEDDAVAVYNIIVQDVVSPVQLEVNSVSSSSHSCNVTLTCSTADSHISSTFRCDSQKCDQDGGNQSKIINSSSTLQVYLSDVTVICKHRNQVSSTEDRTDIQHVCPQLTGSHSVSDGISFCRVKIVVFSAGLFLMVSALISVHLFLKLKKQK
ncbi:SLAM family member 5-like [Salarias fasciatus]|uniref:SLAM family member 5-like n=1 Tax=Salarias fasciatus TaxID=181472 RepID=UPI0011768F8C|nr:SLAM family member 5-like [Salarias fasciatus]